MSAPFIELEKLNEGAGFFATYAADKSERFAELFPDATQGEIAAMDNLLSDMWGRRLLQRRYADIYDKSGASACMSRVVSNVDLLHFEEWLKLQAAIKSALDTDIEKPIVETKTIGETSSSENSGNELRKVYAYDNQQTASNDSENDSSGSSGSELSRTETIERNRDGVINSAAAFVDFARNNDFLAVAMQDIVAVCCLAF